MPRSLVDLLVNGIVPSVAFAMEAAYLAHSPIALAAIWLAGLTATCVATFLTAHTRRSAALLGAILLGCSLLGLGTIYARWYEAALALVNIAGGIGCALLATRMSLIDARDGLVRGPSVSQGR